MRTAIDPSQPISPWPSQPAQLDPALSDTFNIKEATSSRSPARLGVASTRSEAPRPREAESFTRARADSQLTRSSRNTSSSARRSPSTACRNAIKPIGLPWTDLRRSASGPQKRIRLGPVDRAIVRSRQRTRRATGPRARRPIPRSRARSAPDRSRCWGCIEGRESGITGDRAPGPEAEGEQRPGEEYGDCRG
jgi:hypothetical protein